MWLPPFVVVCLLLSCTTAADRLQLEKQTLDLILAPDKYDVTIRPQGTNGTEDPVVVRTNTYIRSISEVDDIKMEYKLQITFRQNWRDSRLAYDDRRGLLRYVTVMDPSKVWKPDTFFSNERKGHFHNIITPNILMRITPAGDVMFSVRVSLTLSCVMDLKHYPMDSQICSLIMASYAYTTNDIIFLWENKDPVQMTKSMNMPQFTLKKYATDYCTSRTSTGEYTCLRVDFHLSRELNAYLVRAYIPQVMLVLLSWLPFWLDYRATVARMAIWLTMLLAMTIIAISIQSNAPSVSYAKAIDVWSGTCLTFLLVVVIELVLVMNCVDEEDKVRKADIAEEEALEKPLMNIDDHAEKKERSSRSKFGRVERWLNRYKSRGQKIDVMARICFPLAFALFNLFYWSSYMAKN